MAELTEIKTIRFSKNQVKIFEKLEAHNVDVPFFIRQAIREKIDRDWKNIKNEFLNQCPF